MKIFVQIVTASMFVVVLAPVLFAAGGLVDQSVTTLKDQAVSIDPLAGSFGDFDLNSITLSSPINGTAQYISKTEQIHYQPNDGFVGTASFTVALDKLNPTVLGQTQQAETLVSSPALFDFEQTYSGSQVISFGLIGQTYAAQFNNCTVFDLDISLLASIVGESEQQINLGEAIESSLSAFGQSYVVDLDNDDNNPDYKRRSFTNLSREDIEELGFDSFAFAIVNEAEGVSVKFPNEGQADYYPSSASFMIEITPQEGEFEGGCNGEESALITVEVVDQADVTSGSVLGATDDNSGSVLGADDTLADTGVGAILQPVVGLSLVFMASAVTRRRLQTAKS